MKFPWIDYGIENEPQVKDDASFCRSRDRKASYV
jgi:hypothetical protein